MATKLATTRGRFAQCPREECDHWRSLIWDNPSDETLALAFIDWAQEHGDYSYGFCCREVWALREFAFKVKENEEKACPDSMRKSIIDELKKKFLAKIRGG
jgi:hypothetical protein